MLAERVRQRDAVAVDEPPQLVLVAHRARGGGRAEERAAEARALLVGPVDESHVSGGSPSSAIRRSTSTPARTLRQPSSQPPFGTESMWPPIRSARVGAAAEREPLVARLVDLVLGAGPRELRPRATPAALPRLRPRDPLRPVLVPVRSRSSSSSSTVRDGSSGIGARAYNVINGPDGAGGSGEVAIARAPAVRQRARAAAGRVGTVVLVLAALWGLWELYRWIWMTTGWTRPFPSTTHDAAHPHDPEGARRAVAVQGAAADHGAAEVGVVHGEGGGRRVRPRRLVRVPARACSSSTRGCSSAGSCPTSSRRRRCRSSRSRRWSWSSG